MSPPPTPLAQARLGDWVRFALLVLFWGASFGLTKIAVAEIAPAWTVSIRTAIAAVLIYGYMSWQRMKLPGDARFWVWSAALAVLGNVIPYFMLAWGAARIDSSLAGILAGMMPLFLLALASRLLPDEPVSLIKVAGFSIGFIGLLLVIGPEKLLGIGGRGGLPLGEGAIICAAISYASYAVAGRLAPPWRLDVLVCGVMIVGALISTAVALLAAPLPSTMPSPSAAISLLAIAVLPTALNAILVFELLRRVGATFVAATNYLIPCVAALIGVLFLGERLHPLDLVGFGFILLGIYVSRQPRWLTRAA